MIHRVADDTSGRTLEAWVQRAGRDIVIVVGGGAEPHVGTVVLSQPTPGKTSPSSSVMTIPPHKEEAIARPIAEEVCRATGRVTVVTAGVHEEDLDAEGIKTYLDLAHRLALELAEALTPESGDTIR